MGEQFIRPKITVRSTGIPGRHIATARANHVVVDDGAAHGGPGEAVGASELFLMGIATCATMMMERIACAEGLDLQRVEVEMESLFDMEAKRSGPPVLDRARIVFRMAGIDETKAREMVEAYKRY